MRKLVDGRRHMENGAVGIRGQGVHILCTTRGFQRELYLVRPLRATRRVYKIMVFPSASHLPSTVFSSSTTYHLPSTKHQFSPFSPTTTTIPTNYIN